MGLDLASLFGGGDVIREIGETVRQIIPDPKAQLDFQMKMAELADKTDERANALDLGQIQTNTEEAKNSNIFVAGWRPFIGWVCGVSLAWSWMVAPTIGWVAKTTGHDFGVPSIPINDTYPIIMGMLGLGGLHTYEKAIGVSADINGKINTPIKAVHVDPAVVVPAAVVAPAVVAPVKKGWFK